MSIQLLDANEAERFRIRMNNDPEFKLVGRDMTVDLLIEFDNEGRLIKVRDGEVKAVGRFVPMTEPVDIIIKGRSEFWNNLLSPVPAPRFQNLYAGMHAGNCEIGGNSELYNAYLPAINRIIDVLRELRND